MACNAPHTVSAQVQGAAEFGTAPYSYAFEALTNDMTIDTIVGDTANVCLTPCTTNSIKVTATDAKGCVKTKTVSIPPACYVEMTNIVAYCNGSESLLQVQFTSCGTSGALFLIVAPASDPFNTKQLSVLASSGSAVMDISDFAGFDDLVVTLGDQQNFQNCQDQETNVEALDCCPGNAAIVQQNVSNTYAIDQENHVFAPITNDKDVQVTYDCVVTKNGNPYLTVQKTDLGDFLRYGWTFDLDQGGYLKEMQVTTDAGKLTITFDDNLTFDLSPNNSAAIKTMIEDSINTQLAGKTFFIDLQVLSTGQIQLWFYGIHNPTGSYASVEKTVDLFTFSENGNTETNLLANEQSGNQSIGQANFSEDPCEFETPCGETIKAYYRGKYVDSATSDFNTRGVENPNTTLTGAFGSPQSSTCVIKKLTAVLSGTTSNVSSYLWEVLSGDGNFDGANNTQTVEVYGTGSATFKVTITTADGCVYTATKNVIF